MYFRRLLRWVVKGKTSVAEEHIYSWELPEIDNILKKVGLNMARVDFIDTGDWNTPASMFARILPRITKHSLLVEATNAELRKGDR